MADKPKALRLADALENLEATGYGDCFSLTPYSEKQAELAAAELRRLSAVEAERDALRADAERYRWLRSARDENFWHCHEKDGYGGQILMYGVDLDAAIDAATKGGGNG